MNKKSDRPILVYRFSSLGDIAMTVPVLRSFFNSYPNQKIVFVSRPYASAMFEEFENLEFISVDLNNTYKGCLLYTSPSPRDLSTSRMPSSA